jgi:5-formyltetrahydrofolate cyclo-ligase
MNKQAMRAEARARLATMSAEERAVASARIADRVWTVPEIAGARTILIYSSIQSEVETGTIAAEARRRGITLVYPRCLPETRAMVLHRVEGPEALREGTFGIREPDPACPVTEVGKLDAALVPGLAWDRHAVRLGRGAGYYDRLFASAAWRGFRCGLFFALQEFERLAYNRLDAPMNAVVTEAEVIRF